MLTVAGRTPRAVAWLSKAKRGLLPFGFPMVSDSSGRVRFLWRRLTRLDQVALAIALLYAIAWLLRAAGRSVPLGSLAGFLFFLAVAYLLIRLLAFSRSRLLWSLRNRLIIAYVFIAVVPVLLLLAMAGLSAYLIYSQLGAYLVYNDLQRQVEKIGGTADALATVLSSEGARGPAAPASSPAVAELLTAARAQLPGLEMAVNAGDDILRTHGGPNRDRFAGLVQQAGKVQLRAIVALTTSSGRLVVAVSAPVTPEFLEALAPELGPIQLVVTRPASPEDQQAAVFQIGNRQFVPLGQISPRRRALPPAVNWLDYKVDGIAKLEAVTLNRDSTEQGSNPLFVPFSARPSQLNRRLFSSLGELSDLASLILLITGVIFLILEVAALITGIVLTRTITGAVADLYRATQYVQAGDLTHRIRIGQKDQLGALAESFNLMTGSISALIEEQRQHQRLENELAIAREVQSQLFPRVLPQLPGIELQAVCRAARVVSGDYYDFVRLSPTRLGIVIADISGKGISAALLMASLQAALRSQLLLDGASPQSTAELVARLNRHLFLNTPEDRYATLFYAVYDATTRALCYTNAGHLPPLYIVGERVAQLEQGGTVIGLFGDCAYEQGTVQIEPGSLLVAYSDGLIEPENVYGEEFGTKRLLEVALRHRDAPPLTLAEALVSAAEEWAGSPEQADDMTVVLARMR